MNDSGQNRGTLPGTGRCLFTVNLEEYFEVKALWDYIPPAEWDTLPARAERSLDPLLGLLRRHGARATFFVSPWVASSRPAAVRRVAVAGHEVGVLMRMPARHVDVEDRRAVWKRTLRETRDRLEQLTGRQVLGCRSERFHHDVPVEQALEFLAAEGFRYDSTLNRNEIASLLDESGGDMPASMPTPAGPILVVPPTTVSLLGKRLFTVGRTAFRVLPLMVTRRVLSGDLSGRYGGVFCLRSWELDPAQPTLPVSLASKVRLYWGLDRVHTRLDRLLGDFEFDSVAGALGLEASRLPGGAEERASGPRSRRGERPGTRKRRMHG